MVASAHLSVEFSKDALGWVTYKEHSSVVRSIPRSSMGLYYNDRLTVDSFTGEAVLPKCTVPVDTASVDTYKAQSSYIIN